MKKGLLALSLFILAAGCHTPQPSQNLPSTTGTVLIAHHFAPPTIVMGKDQVLWAVAARPQSGSAVQMARVKVNPDGHASVEITSYQFIGSDWATVGRLLDQGPSKAEADEIQAEIERRLRTQQ